MARCRIIRFIYLLTLSAVTFFIASENLTTPSDPTIVIYNRKAVKHVKQQRVNTSRKDTEEMKIDTYLQDIKYKRVVKSRNSSVYMYSAIQNLVPNRRKTLSYEEATAAQIVVNGWELNEKQNSNFICCHMMGDESVIPISSSEKRNWLYLGMSKLQAKQYTCHSIKNNSRTEQISIESPGSMCPTEKKYYKVVEHVHQSSNINQRNRNKTIAVCSKLAYGSLDSKRLIEWFEVHRMFGVDKVFSYLYKLNSAAKKVFEYYENLGMAQSYEFHLPEKESVTREVGSKNMQSWNDEQVTLYDCQERTRNYDYVAVVDTDEFMVPSTNVLKNAWKTFFNSRFQNPYIAGFFVPVSIHATSWGPSRPNHPLFIGQYNNSTLPMFDRVKGIYMPSRVQPGSVSTHMFKPLEGYKRGLITGRTATLHHFRSCRKEWLKRRSVQNIKQENNHLYHLQNATKCFDFRRFSSDIMQRVADAVQESVSRVINEIGV